MLKPFWIKWTFIAWLDMLQKFLFPPTLTYAWGINSIFPTSISCLLHSIHHSHLSIRPLVHPRASVHFAFDHSMLRISFTLLFSGVSSMHASYLSDCFDSTCCYVVSKLVYTTNLFYHWCFFRWNHCPLMGVFMSIDQFGYHVDQIELK